MSHEGIVSYHNPNSGGTTATGGDYDYTKADGTVVLTPIVATAAPNSTDTVADTSMFIGVQLAIAGDVRLDYYNPRARALDAADNAGRRDLKIATRAKTPGLVRGVIESVRPGTGPGAGSVGHANVTNAFWDRLGVSFKYGGRALVVGAAIYDGISIYTSDNRGRTSYEVLFGNAGALGLGAAGAAGGTLLDPFIGPAGTIGGGVAGGAAGSASGRAFGGLLWDSGSYWGEVISGTRSFP